MPRSLSITLLSVAFCCVANAVAQEHLTPEKDVLAGPNQYHVKISRVFAEPLRHDILVQALFLPSFQLEELIGIRKAKTGFEAFASKPSSQIWTTYNIWQAENGQMTYQDERGNVIPPENNPQVQDMKKRAPSSFRDIRVHTARRALPPAVANRIRAVWQDMVLNARTPTERELGLDGETFHFSVRLPTRGSVSATVWSPNRGKTLALVQLVHALADYARHRADEATLLKVLRPLEPKQA